VKKIYSKIGLFVLSVIFINGCANKTGPTLHGSVDEALATYKKQDENWNIKPYQMKIKPIIGSRQNDARVIVDTGKVLKIWVAPYKQVRTLIAAHDVYTMVEKPSFIVGEMVPSGHKNDGLVTCQGDYPFVFKDRHLETVKPQDRFKNENIKSYVNNVYKVQQEPSRYEEQRKKNSSKYDSVIKDYIKQREKR